ncbi:MAG: ATP-binding protein [Bacteroidales bacterium]|nr:ATP-binding protein [Bacteroidales bacterium]
MIENRVRYPIGEQDFKKLRENGCVYVDKTYLIPELTWGGGFLFLARPRRFGKSLLLSTLHYYFDGAKELFEGLWIGEHEKEWKRYPVLHFDMSRCAAQSADEMKGFLHRRLEEYEKKYEIGPNGNIEDVGERFSILIQSISEKAECNVVILIDEYDKGILETMDDPARLEDMSIILRAFFSQPKAMSKYVHFCMVTGVARFPNYTLFSGPNNLSDISMNRRFASICGITQQELVDNFQPGIAELGEFNDWTKEETIEALRLKYDSYRFTPSQEKVYNPFSLLNAFYHGELDNYWIKSGISRVFVKYLSRSEFDLLELQDLWVDKKRMEDIFRKEDSIPLLFQTGYLTIVETKGQSLFRLAIPNGEVRSALVDQLLPRYLGINVDRLPMLLEDLKEKVLSADIDGWIKELQQLVSKVPYHLYGKTSDEGEEDTNVNSIERFERTYHIIVHIIFQLLSLDARSEICVSGGRIDMVVETSKLIYVIEFKLDGKPQEAIAQIDSKSYLLSWSADGRAVYKIGIVFSSQNRSISDWEYITGLRQ